MRSAVFTFFSATLTAACAGAHGGTVSATGGGPAFLPLSPLFSTRRSSFPPSEFRRQSRSRWAPQEARRKEELWSRATALCGAVSEAPTEGSLTEQLLRILTDGPDSAIKAAGWASWWIQLIFSVVSAVTLAFAYNTQNFMRRDSNPLSPLLDGSLFTAASLLLAFFGVAQSWRFRFHEAPVVKGEETASAAFARSYRKLRGLLAFAESLNGVGLGVSLLGASEIIGVLFSKVVSSGQLGVLSTGQTAPLGTALAVQPLDILILQANLNLSLCHFFALCAALWLERKVLRARKEGNKLLNEANFEVVL
uniref:Transmembrane protein n=1 Tax=Chromera velia CCMP2878 TaxID=1169474 RepID=A0A0G4GCK5_9ALVE|eukprot:Cvel_21297.t1-p1 / transcript=Cvel_21297.t1 / gene=Cvel_21297 / organism=Chromera_velia_CCMP2878 / gene_product=hypothetical protein / transcript_product=hypothetical protein / location=Cvel_scaffold1984:7787-10445(+) / protein_length=307 / sequence_SO=supercontig / SO=protein_coding / is_pseudo=false